MSSTAKRLCIVCGRPIAKRTSDFFFREPVAYQPPKPHSWGGDHNAIEAKPDGWREGNSIYLHQRPRSREEAQRYVNGEIISVRRDGEVLSRVSYWDGESWQDRFFCTNRCAMDQGYASAQHGHRYLWKSRS
ncbi:hypothetical protein [Sphingomonas pituitosa]|uniref:hypothetical protein n=1 Tax=Sphingomonas pituitosa TaxID=99597 RepID=UPI00083325AF|nr:hypothetical protein [Sphingomonas pituitosa]